MKSSSTLSLLLDFVFMATRVALQNKKEQSFILILKKNKASI